jgi:hypothetical protein
VLLFIVGSGVFMVGVGRLGRGCCVVFGRVVFRCALFLLMAT